MSRLLVIGVVVAVLVATWHLGRQREHRALLERMDRVSMRSGV